MAEGPASVAVVDVGKTNVRVSAARADGHVVETIGTANAVLAGPPWRHHDLAGLGAFVFETLAALARRHPIERVIAAGHGSGGVLVGDDPDAGGDGAALPMIDYEQPLPAGIAEAYAPLAGDFLDRGSAIMMAATHQARQLLWMERDHPDAVAAARFHLGIPQYWAWRLSGRAVSEASFLGAQSHLWNVPARRFTPIVRARGWERLMPPFAAAHADLGPVRPELARRFGFPEAIRVHAGVHDSTANAYRYRAAGRADLMVVSTGTWIVALAGDVPLDRLVEARGMTLNADVDGRPVGGALTMGGREFAAIAGAQPDGAVADPALAAALIERGTMALPSFGDNDGQFPGTAGRGRIAGPPPEGAAERLALAVVTMALLTVACLDRLDGARAVVLDGSYLRDPLYARLVAALRPGRETLSNAESYGVAAGAALLAGHAARTAPVQLALERPDPFPHPGLVPYARAWRAAAEASVPADIARRDRT